MDFEKLSRHNHNSQHAHSIQMHNIIHTTSQAEQSKNYTQTLPGHRSGCSYIPSSNAHVVANNDVQLISLQESSYQYWPPVGQVIVFGEYTVDLISEEPLTGFTVRKISVLDKKVRFLYT